MTVINMNGKSAATASPIVGAGRVGQHWRDPTPEPVRAANDPAGFHQLGAEEQAALVGWIREVLMPARMSFRRNSYGMKHDFERDQDGFYICNGAFKGAMLAAGHHPVDANELNWRFRVKPSHPLGRWEQHKLKRYGRGWLVRGRWREVGYLVLESTQTFRALRHAEDCRRERCPEVVVLRAKYTAKIKLDTVPAGCRLTPAGVAAVLRLFAEFDPAGRYSYVSYAQTAEIRRVPAHRAENLAAALANIAKHCSMLT
jgi:hypothetical protein